MWVAEEDLVAAEARENDGEAGLTRGARNEVSVDAVDGRLIHRVPEIGECLEKLGGSHRDLVVIGSVSLRDLSGVRALVELWVVEHDGEGRERLLRVPARDRDESRGVDAAA